MLRIRVVCASVALRSLCLATRVCVDVVHIAELVLKDVRESDRDHEWSCRAAVAVIVLWRRTNFEEDGRRGRSRPREIEENMETILRRHEGRDEENLLFAVCSLLIFHRASLRNLAKQNTPARALSSLQSFSPRRFLTPHPHSSFSWPLG
ncbi:hypothetical protein P153DRAFT_68509 [Dothidotthia symphoricarpi CBS 119687]|uniref:Secreted protein n=1 Tax=Dothidotthia symphoricarpi CBS 119687 TaxID=1392245 RepID=A0A6A6A489_9PLEO|nr:uncharacterized protein P153DRAFT_68509 [Dothidotthia symphoricarpi CBS 119687]KAF2126709.1 hypothetical protein P153DRAFT_68509 [Dothidotthia symphoricarpi CBS 119687]